ncbi:hypothetical protein ACLOJK_032412 [Asimina triloba]
MSFAVKGRSSERMNADTSIAAGLLDPIDPIGRNAILKHRNATVEHGNTMEDHAKRVAHPSDSGAFSSGGKRKAHDGRPRHGKDNKKAKAAVGQREKAKPFSFLVRLLLRTSKLFLRYF